MKYTDDELLREWEHTWSRHHGDVNVGAAIFNFTPQALDKRFYRMRAKGYQVRWHYVRDGQQ